MNYNELFQIVEKRFSQTEKAKNRFAHSVRVVDKAIQLNKELQLGLDEEKVKVAAILHDYAKVLKEEEQLLLLSKYVDKDQLEYYKMYLPVIHSVLGRYLVQEDMAINDSEILDAITYHTTGCVGMSQLTKLIFVSDAIEDGRNYPFVEAYRIAAMLDLDYAAYIITAMTIKYLKNNKMNIEKNTLDLYNYYEEYYDKISK